MKGLEMIRPYAAMKLSDEQLKVNSHLAPGIALLCMYLTTNDLVDPNDRVMIGNFAELLRIAISFEEKAYSLGFDFVVESRLKMMKSRLEEMDLKSDANGDANVESVLDAALARAKGGILSKEDCLKIYFAPFQDWMMKQPVLLFRICRKIAPYLRKHYEINSTSDECMRLLHKVIVCLSLVQLLPVHWNAIRYLAQLEWAASLHLVKLNLDQRIEPNFRFLFSIYRAATNGIIAEQRKDLHIVPIAQYALLVAEANSYLQRICFASVYDPFDHMKRKGVSKGEGKLVCSGCKQVRYCSVECQKQWWKSHKIVCKAFPTLEASRAFIFSYQPPDLRKEMMEYFDFVESRLPRGAVYLDI